MAIGSRTASTDRTEIGAARCGVLLCVAALVAGCATTPGAPEAPPPQRPGEAAPPTPPGPPPAAPPSLGFFSRIKTPDSVEPVLRLQGRGAQVFRCEARGSAFTWVYRLPEADLVDAGGKALVRHGANFSFEHADGSRLLGTVVEFDEAPDPKKDLRWLLLSTRSFGDGALSGITFVQRVNTIGGMPPAKCDAGQQSRLLRVDFSADFVFYKPR
jgi:hypothetical protein